MRIILTSPSRDSQPLTTSPSILQQTIEGSGTWLTEQGDFEAWLKSLLFQALEAKPSLTSMLPNTSRPGNVRLLGQDRHFILDLLWRVLARIGLVFIVLDGFDELDETSRNGPRGQQGVSAHRRCRGRPQLRSSPRAWPYRRGWLKIHSCRDSRIGDAGTPG